MNELKPCPFCGGKAKINLLCGNYCVTCTRCLGAILPFSGSSKEDAAEDWNKRIFGWISVRDRLPETRNPVLVTNEYGDFYLANCSSGIWTEHFREKANFISVTHWMPIPEPPEMKGE